MARKGSEVGHSYHNILAAWRADEFVKDRQSDATEIVRQLTSEDQNGKEKRFRVSPEQVLRTFDELADVIRCARRVDIRSSAMIVIHSVILVRGIQLPKGLFVELLRVAGVDRDERVYEMLGFIYDGLAKNGRREIFRTCLREVMNDLRLRYQALGGYVRRREAEAKIAQFAATLDPKLKGKRDRTLAKIRGLREQVLIRAIRERAEPEDLKTEIVRLQQEIADAFPGDPLFETERAQMRPLEAIVYDLRGLELCAVRCSKLLRRM